MQFPRKPNFKTAGATIFTVVPKVNERDSLTGESPFTTTNTPDAGVQIGAKEHVANATSTSTCDRDVTNETGRTLNGERTPCGKDKTVMWPPLTDKDRAWINGLSPDAASPSRTERDVPNQDMMRSLPLGDKEKDSPLKGLSGFNAKLNGT